MRIRIQEEHFAELSFVEVVCEIFHRVGADASDVLVLTRMKLPQHIDSILHVIADLHADFHSDRDLVRVGFAEADEEAAVAAAN